MLDTLAVDQRQRDPAHVIAKRRLEVGVAVSLIQERHQGVELARLVVDTSASCTAIDAVIPAALGLMPTGQIAIHTPSTYGLPHACNQYDVGLSSYGAASEIVYVNTALPIIEGQLEAQGIDGLLGREKLCPLPCEGRVHRLDRRSQGNLLSFPKLWSKGRGSCWAGLHCGALAQGTA
jgi:hypothetical protein